MPDDGGPYPSWDEAAAELATEVRRVADRLRSLSQARLAAPAPPYPSRAAAARSVARLIAEAEQGIAARQGPVEPAWRGLPDLGDLAVGDQLAVTGHDLLSVIEHVRPDDDVWARGRRRTARDVVTEVAGHLAELRRSL